MLISIIKLVPKPLPQTTVIFIFFPFLLVILQVADALASFVPPNY
ncbi:hypothetical protein YPPY92_2990 [Yersinia pestis PY-92]|nr:hypothetical protein YPPY07_2867 [Yersinia pestis PY-07]EIR73251.1 hypothetical protein YPPY29_2823 [Yersinia pestis PY-29]EIT14233.1 hypothetical protein YPPY92_2990 [Yersinia pestis PY-92]EIT56543.1 hypothetical protein YPPY103_3121 [Yersinia pestis PY-103]